MSDVFVSMEMRQYDLVISFVEKTVKILDTFDVIRVANSSNMCIGIDSFEAQTLQIRCSKSTYMCFQIYFLSYCIQNLTI